MKPVRTLVLLAADHGIRLLVNAGPGTGLAEVSHTAWADLPEADFEFRDRAPRGMSADGSRHAYEPRHTEAEKERQSMVDHAISVLSETWATGSYDRIVISAPDKVLGQLRKALPDGLKAHLLADLDKDLLKVPTHDLPAHFDKVAVF